MKKTTIKQTNVKQIFLGSLPSQPGFPRQMEELLVFCFMYWHNTIIIITNRLTEFWFALHWMIGILVTLSLIFFFFFFFISYFYLCIICQTAHSSKGWGPLMLCKVYVPPWQIAFIMLFRCSWIMRLVMPAHSCRLAQLSFPGRDLPSVNTLKGQLLTKKHRARKFASNQFSCLSPF